MRSLTWHGSRWTPLFTALFLTACGGSDGDGADARDASESPETAETAAAAEVPSQGPDVWVATLVVDDSGVPTVGEPRNVTSRPGYDDQPHFLADGSLLFTRQEEGATDIWRWDPAAGGVSPVTRTNPESEYSATPRPSSDHLSVVRVEADSTQRLWSFDRQGGDARVLLPDIAPVGYHAWVSPDTVALFVLGEPATLQVASLASGSATVLAEDIGRSLQTVPGAHAFSYVQRNADGTTVIRVHDVATGEVRDAATGLDGGDFHAWTPSGVLLQASGGALFFWHEGMGHWMMAADFSHLGLRLSRLAVSPDGASIAMVAVEEGTP